MPFIIALTLIAIEVLILILHLVVYATLAAAFGVGSIWLEVIFIILAFTFVSASFIDHFVKGKWIDVYYTLSAYWFGLAGFLFIGALIFYFGSAIFYSQGIYIAPWVMGTIGFGIALAVHTYGTWKSQHPVVTRIRVPFSHLPGFHADFWKGKKVVFVSDFQLGNVYRERFVEKVVKKINALDPYSVFIGGDLYDGVECNEASITAPLAGLHPPGGTYFVTGNHEYYSRNWARSIAAVRALGITVLDDKKADLGGIELIGVDFKSTEKKENFERVLAGIGVAHDRPSILLKHVPSDLGIAEKAGISLDLSGHTHHGQIFPIMLFTWQMYHGYDYGLKPHGKMQVMTSSGVGTWGTPLRLGTKSEIVQIEFE